VKEKFWDITLVKPEEIEKHTQSGVTQSLEKFETQVNSKFNELSIKFDISMKTIKQNNIKLTTKFSNIVEHQNDLLIMIATPVQSTLALMHQNMICMQNGNLINENFNLSISLLPPDMHASNSLDNAAVSMQE